MQDAGGRNRWSTQRETDMRVRKGLYSFPRAALSKAFKPGGLKHWQLTGQEARNLSSRSWPGPLPPMAPGKTHSSLPLATGVADNPWCSLACRCIVPIRLSSHGLLPVSSHRLPSVCLRPCLPLMRHSHSGLGVHSTPKAFNFTNYICN